MREFKVKLFGCIVSPYFGQNFDSLREEIFRLKNTASGKPAEKEVKEESDIVAHSRPGHREPVPGRDAPKTSTRMYIGRPLMKTNSNMTVGMDIFLYTALVWILSSELFSWMDLMKFSQSYKLALSILWGVYALLLIVLGIWKNKKHIRIIAIVLFSVTLLKLFF